MPSSVILLDPVDHITVDAIGSPGNRVFYIEGHKDGESVCLIIEKIQLQSLITTIDDFLDQIKDKFPAQIEEAVDFSEKEMRIEPPVDPRFRVGEMGLAYDAGRDVVNIIAKEMVLTGNPDSGAMVRYGCSRGQVLALARWGSIVIERGRPICPQCLQPMEPEGHFCPKKNGHKKSEDQ